MEIVVRVPGSCGELVQGSLSGKPFLVTCPIDCYTEVRVSDSIQGIHGLGRKSLTALERTMSILSEEEFPWGLQLTSCLPHGKGMASSSADIGAVAAAVSLSYGIPLSSHQILQIASDIEPTDGVFLPGIVRMDYIAGEVQEQFPALPALQLAVFDTGGEIDTIVFNQQANLATQIKKKEALMKSALKLLRQGTDQSVAEAATISALAHQSILPKDRLKEIWGFAQREGALGICVAHSGTVLGLLWHSKAEESELNGAVAHIASRFPHISFLRRARLIAGGTYRIV